MLAIPGTAAFHLVNRVMELAIPCPERADAVTSANMGISAQVMMTYLPGHVIQD